MSKEDKMITGHDPLPKSGCSHTEQRPAEALVGGNSDSHSDSRANALPGNEYLCIAPDVKLGKGVKLAKFINLYGCKTGIHYPIALHLTKAYEGLGFRVGDFPVAEKVVSQVLSLPMFPDLTSRSRIASWPKC